MYPSTRIQSLVELSLPERSLIDQLFVPRSLERKEDFLAFGQTCQQIAIVEQGCLRYFMLKDGEEFTYAFAKAGDFVSNYESFLSQTPSNKIIQAVEETKIWTLSRNGLQRIYDEVQYGDRFGRIVLEQVFLRTLQQLSSYYVDSPTDRYLHFLQDYRELEQRIPQYLIASFVGIKPQSLSRIRKRLADRTSKS